MTRYYTNFEDATIGSTVPLGWTQRFTALAAGERFATQYATTPVVKKRELFHFQFASLSMASYDAVDNDANRGNAEVLTLFRRYDNGSPTQGATSFNVVVRGSGGTGSENCYMVRQTYFDAGSPNLLKAIKYVAGAATDPVGAAVSSTIDATKAYWMRVRVQDEAGSPTAVRIQARVWASDVAEPTTWQLDITDASLFGTAGWVGLQVLGRSPLGGGGGFQFMSVGTNGDTAWKPRTDAEFDTWLNDQTAVRRHVFEMSATGYDNGGSPPATFTKTVYAYIADGGYASQAWDSPANQAYAPWVSKVPSMDIEMGVALSGRATTAFGQMEVTNPVITSGQGGVRDDWLRIKWNRSFLYHYLGDPSWPKHDFRLQTLGRLGQPVSGGGNIVFPVLDVSDLFDAPVQTNTYTSGNYQGQRKPIVFGRVSWGDTVCTDSTNLIYQVHDTSGGDLPASLAEFSVLDDGVIINSTSALLGGYTVDAATDEIIFGAAHGFPVGSSLVWSVAPPAPLVAGTTYYSLAGSTSARMKVAATVGGAAINLTTTTANTFNLYPYQYDNAAGTIKLLANPAGVVITLNTVSYVASETTEAHISGVLAKAIFTRGGISLNHKDQASFDALYSGIALGAVGYRTGLDMKTIREVVEDLTRGTNTFYAITNEGLIQVGVFGLPSSTADAEFTASDVKDGYPRLIDIVLPIDFTTTPVTYNPPYLGAPYLYRGGPVTVIGGTQLRPTFVYPPFAYSGGSVPLDNFPARAQVRLATQFDTIYNVLGGPSERTRLAALYLRPLGVFEVHTKLRGMRVNIGRTVSISNPQEGWKQWTVSDPASLDNLATVDSRLAVVCGKRYDPNTHDPFPVTLRVYRPIPGYYPTANLS